VGADPPDARLASTRAPDRGVARRQAFLQAAREVFLEQGYEAASVNDVVRRAGGSLATLYSQFGNKEGLFLAFALDQHERFTRDMRPDNVDHLPLEQGLIAIGEHYLRAILTRDSLAFYRILVSEGRKFPVLIQRRINSVAENPPEVVSDYLERRAKADGFTVTLPHAAAFFNGLVRSRHHYFGLVDPAYQLAEADLKAHVRTAVTIFMNGAVARQR
jgi:AcrR family transcriptional regulator